MCVCVRVYFWMLAFIFFSLLSLFISLSLLAFFYLVKVAYNDSVRARAFKPMATVIVSTSMKIHSQFLADISIRINFNSLRGEKLSQIQFISLNVQLSHRIKTCIHTRTHTHKRWVYICAHVTIRFLKYFIFKCESLFSLYVEIFCVSIVRYVCCNNHMMMIDDYSISISVENSMHTPINRIFP